EDAAPKSPVEACQQLLHGDSRNRWFDKALSFISFPDGTAGINVEHSGLDGNTIVNFADTLLGRTAAEHSRQSGAKPQGIPAIESIEFALDARLQADVRAAGDSFAAQAANTATCVLSFDDFGADRAKRLRVSPDAFVQMAYQLAHKRARGLVGATYESIATDHHQHGRTEAMRVVTPEAVRFVAAMDDPHASQAARRTAFRAAAEQHVTRKNQCQAGRAPRATPVGAAADSITPRQGTRCAQTPRPVRVPRLAQDARRLPEHQLRTIVAQHPLYRFRPDQQPVHRHRLHAVSRPAESSPERAWPGRR